MTDEYYDGLADGEVVDCWNCGGEGEIEYCPEDTCTCLDPPCMTCKCEICHGKGGWKRGERAA